MNRVSSADASIQLAQIALAIADTHGLGEVCNSLEIGRLTAESTSTVRASVAGGNRVLEIHLQALQRAWVTTLPSLSGEGLALLLRSCAASVAAYRLHAPTTQVVWTGPLVQGSFLRATREVVREMLRASRRELLLVGYWIAARDDGEGIIEEVIASLAEAVVRGVAVRVVVDERARADGRDNRQILVSTWPFGVSLPKILTWRLPSTDLHLKLHAKVLVADRSDALVTSANLTAYAMDRNMEMGVRVGGYPAMDIAKHFDLLETLGVLEPYAEERARI